MIRRISALAGMLLGLALACACPAVAQQSTVNPLLPPQNSPLASAPVRGNFAATNADINRILAMGCGVSGLVTFELCASTAANPTPLQIFDGTALVTWGTLDRTTHQFGVALSGLSVAGTAPIAVTFPGGLATIALNAGTSVANPGTGNPEMLTPAQTVAGASKTFATADLFFKTRRSNSGSAMSDTFPAFNAVGMVNGTRIIYSNVDVTATATITAGSGTLMASGGTTDTIEPGRDVCYEYDASVTQWRGCYNTRKALLGPNNLSDLSSTATARTNLGVPGLSGGNAWSGTQTGMTLASPTFSGTVAGSNTIPLSILAQVGAKALLGNATAGTANVTATGYTASSTDSTIAAVHGAITSGNIHKSNDTAGTIADAGFSVALGSTGQLAYWSSGSAVGGENIASALTQGTGISLSGTTNVTIALATPVSLANGGTAQASALAARGSSGLNIDECTSTGDANYGIASTDRCVYHTALSAARTDTLPAANSVNAGQVFYLTDFAGVASASHTVTLQRAGADTINGVTSQVAVNAQYGAAIYWSDGSSRWTFFPATAGGGGTVTSVATGWGLTGGTISTSGTLSVATSNPAYGFDAPVNLSLSASVASNLLTITVTGNNGSTPSATNPVLIPFPDVTLANGDPSWVALTSALSINTNATGATLGSQNGVPFRFWIAIFNNGGTPVLALFNCSSVTATSVQIYPPNEHTLQSTVGISGSATGVGNFYTPNGTALTSKAFRIIGELEYASGLTTAGTYASVPTSVRLAGPGTKKCGDTVQGPLLTSSTVEVDVTSTTATAALSGTIAPSSTANLIRIRSSGGSTLNPGLTIGALGITRGTAAGTKLIGMLQRNTNAAGVSAGQSLETIDFPATISSQTYTVYLISDGTHTLSYCVTSSGSQYCEMTLEEIQG